MYVYDSALWKSQTANAARSSLPLGCARQDLAALRSRDELASTTSFTSYVSLVGHVEEHILILPIGSTLATSQQSTFCYRREAPANPSFLTAATLVSADSVREVRSLESAHAPRPQGIEDVGSPEEAPLLDTKTGLIGVKIWIFTCHSKQWNSKGAKSIPSEAWGGRVDSKK